MCVCSNKNELSVKVENKPSVEIPNMSLVWYTSPHGSEQYIRAIQTLAANVGGGICS
jgi:hypothetical protein